MFIDLSHSSIDSNDLVVSCLYVIGNISIGNQLWLVKRIFKNFIGGKDLIKSIYVFIYIFIHSFIFTTVCLVTICHYT